ncbi:MAG: glycosyltransferase [Bacteriodetes bacterium]|nr:glycosyltransferase [Bacteroidota bacterium]
MSTTPLFDVIIPTYNNLAELQECLQGFATQTLTNFRVLVCVDGSTDGTIQYLEQTTFPFPVVVLQHADKQNHGRNPTRNLALPFCTAQYICFFDSDIIPDTNLLAEHHAQVTKQQCISVGDVRYINTQTNVWAAYAQTRGKNKYHQGDIIPYYYMATGNCAHNTEHFIALGGQDPHITKYGAGDTEYAIRLHKHTGVPVVFTQRAFGTSAMNKTAAQALQQMEEFGKTNLPYIHTKHPDVDEIFGLRTLQATTFKHWLVRLAIRNTIARVAERMLPILPTALAVRALHYCVMNRILRGWKQREM